VPFLERFAAAADEGFEGVEYLLLSKYAAHCGHVQIASAPKRNEPNNGEVNYSYLFEHLDKIGYRGWVGCEYRPASSTLEGLTWFRQLSDHVIPSR
jgi:hydroxypyruvate isomerase